MTGLAAAISTPGSLPLLREELGLYPGPRSWDGSPSWSLHDPAGNRFFRIGWREFEILRRWDEGDSQRIATRIGTETTLTITPDQVIALTQFLIANHLIQPGGTVDLARFSRQAGQRRPWYLRLLHGYLFFRIPLVRPDHFLVRTLPAVRWFFAPHFWYAMAVTALLGLYLAARQWDTFVRTFDYLFSWEGVLLFLATLLLVKTAHELGHAYTARRFGCRIPVMGVAFLVMWPMLYTETSEVWKLPARNQRLAVGAAGMAAELALAAMATLAWSFLPDGPARSAAFFTATLSWIMTLTFNLNPFMRFDGYYLLSDWLEIHNLHDRAFALGRWRLRKALLGLGDPPPEALPADRLRFLILFSYATWLYRLLLFLGIAMLVYYFFFKVAGLFLMVVEVGWFIVRPILSEWRVWYRRRSEVRINPTTLRSVFLLATLILLTVVPWQTSVPAPGILQRTRHAILYAPAPARVQVLLVAEGDRVETGQTLLRLVSSDLDHRIDQTTQQIVSLQWQLAFRSMHRDLLARHMVIQREWQTRRSEHKGYLRRRDHLTLTAPFAGQVVQLEDHLRVSDWVGEKEPLVYLVDLDGWGVDAYISEDDLGRVAVGSTAIFYPEGLDWTPVPCQLARIDPVSIKRLGETALASRHGGGIPVRENDRGDLIPETGTFRIQLQPNAQISNLDQALRGTVVITGRSQSFLSRLWQSALMVVVRESGF